MTIKRDGFGNMIDAASNRMESAATSTGLHEMDGKKEPPSLADAKGVRAEREAERVREIFVDPIAMMECASNDGPKFFRACHLFAWPGCNERLHEFARKLGLERSLFRDAPARNGRPPFPHYRLTESRRQISVDHGAIETKSRLEITGKWDPDAKMEELVATDDERQGGPA